MRLKFKIQPILKISLVAALAGFLFGFDTVVISGADQQLELLWGSSKLYHGWVVMGMALWGTVVGALMGSFPTKIMGRKYTLFTIGLLYAISALGSAFAIGPNMFAFFRFIGGLGIGISTVAAPTYISEIAPANKRGYLVGLYQFNIVLGILIAFISNYCLSTLGEEAWRFMMGIELLPALVYTGLVVGIPESPRWLILKKKAAKAKAVLVSINYTKDIESIVEAIQKETQNNCEKESIFSKKYRFILWLSFLIAFFNQFSGINAFLYYAPRIFQTGGIEGNIALLSSIGVGLINLIFTLIGIFLIDKLGRRFLMYMGTLGYIISLSLISLSFYSGWQGIYLPFFFFLFIASHAIGQGAVIWVFIAEIYPNHLRAAGQSFGASVHWVLAALIPSCIPFLFAKVGAAFVFALFTFFMVLQLLFVRYLMPETKGIALEKLKESLLQE